MFKPNLVARMIGQLFRFIGCRINFHNFVLIFLFPQKCELCDILIKLLDEICPTSDAGRRSRAGLYAPVR